jgi:hypothetical protein
VTKPLRATFPSMIAFVATVVAWTTKPTCRASTPASASARSTAFMNPCDGSSGVVSVFAIATRPLASSIRVASVNVPPMSIAIRTLISQLRTRRAPARR